jgi:hypothetical protein
MRGDIYKSDWEVYIESEDYARRYNIYIIRYRTDGTADILGRDGLVERTSPGLETPRPTVKLSVDGHRVLQAMANELARKGYKPEGNPVLENELTATKYHLEDMRKLVGLEDKKYK